MLQNLTGACKRYRRGSISFTVKVKDLANFPLNELSNNMGVIAVLSPDAFMAA
ncbi:MAG: hypothetical protein H6577_25515 [Lewinellaceae bacterium]|nr:hypothetical protein [Lewinellaceae bacterium]